MGEELVVNTVNASQPVTPIDASEAHGTAPGPDAPRVDTGFEDINRQVEEKIDANALAGIKQPETTPEPVKPDEPKEEPKAEVAPEPEPTAIDVDGKKLTIEDIRALAANQIKPDEVQTATEASLATLQSYQERLAKITDAISKSQETGEAVDVEKVTDSKLVLPENLSATIKDLQENIAKEAAALQAQVDQAQQRNQVTSLQNEISEVSEKVLTKYEGELPKGQDGAVNYLFTAAVLGERWVRYLQSGQLTPPSEIAETLVQGLVAMGKQKSAESNSPAPAGTLVGKGGGSAAIESVPTNAPKLEEGEEMFTEIGKQLQAKLDAE